MVIGHPYQSYLLISSLADFGWSDVFQLRCTVIPFQLHMVFWDNTNYNSYEMAAKGEDGLAAVAVLYEVRWAECGSRLFYIAIFA